MLARALGADLARRTVVLEDAVLSYDFLVVATGAGHTYFGHDEWRELAPPLKGLDDALEIRRRVLLAFERAEQEDDPGRRHRLLTFVIVGGGPTGVELAGALAEMARHTLVRDFRSIAPGSARILLLEAAGDILASFPPDLRRAAVRSLHRLGVEVRTRSPVTAVTADSITAGAETIPTRTVIWAAGVTAAAFVGTLGVPLDRSGRVRVGPDLTLPGHPEVFVIGDTATLPQPDGTELPGTAPVAIQMGNHAGRCIRRVMAGGTTTAFRYRNLGNLATIGRAAAIADFGRIRLSGGIAWVAWLFIHLMKLVGFRSRILVFVQWAWAYVTYQKSVRLITGGSSAGALPDRPPR